MIVAGDRHEAVVLFAHGARDPAWTVPLDRLAVLVSSQRPAARVVTAFLELQTPTLETAVQTLVDQGSESIVVLPVFWARAGHVAHDLDPAVDALRRAHEGVRFDVLPVLSDLPGLLETIAATVVRELDQRTS